MATQWAGQLGVQLLPEAQTFLFTTTFRLAVGSNHPPIQCVRFHGIKANSAWNSTATYDMSLRSDVQLRTGTFTSYANLSV